jgi:hypothetical protein
VVRSSNGADERLALRALRPTSRGPTSRCRSLRWPVHLSEQRRRHAEAALEGVAEPARRGEPDLPAIALSAGKRSARRSRLVQCVATRLPVRKPRRRQHEGAGVDRLKRPIPRIFLPNFFAKFFGESWLAFHGTGVLGHAPLGPQPGLEVDLTRLTTSAVAHEWRVANVDAILATLDQLYAVAPSMTILAWTNSSTASRGCRRYWPTSTGRASTPKPLPVL